MARGKISPSSVQLWIGNGKRVEEKLAFRHLSRRHTLAAETEIRQSKRSTARSTHDKRDYPVVKI